MDQRKPEAIKASSSTWARGTLVEAQVTNSGPRGRSQQKCQASMTGGRQV